MSDLDIVFISNCCKSQSKTSCYIGFSPLNGNIFQIKYIIIVHFQ